MKVVELSKNVSAVIICLAMALILLPILQLPEVEAGGLLIPSLNDSPVSPITPPTPGGDGGGTDDNTNDSGDGNRTRSEERDETPNPADEGGVIPGLGGANRPISDPDAPNLTIIFSEGSVQIPVQTAAFDTGLRPNIPPPHDRAGQAFFFGVWPRFPGEMVTKFAEPIQLHQDYDDRLGAHGQEANIQLYMYHPLFESWVKIGGRVDPYNRTISVLLSEYIPYGPGQGALFITGINDAPPLTQNVTPEGDTLLTVDGKPVQILVPADTVPVGSHFEVSFATVADRPGIYIGAYQISHNLLDPKIGTTFTTLPKPITLTFDLSEDSQDLTILILQNGVWIDAEKAGYTLHRTADGIAIETSHLGTFLVSAKPPINSASP